MAWNYLQAEIVEADNMIRPLIGPGGLTREQAHAEIQTILDNAAATNPAIKQLAATWKRGAKDDTVGMGPFIWTIYEHAAAEARKAAHAWLEDFAATMRTAGLNVGIAKLPHA